MIWVFSFRVQPPERVISVRNGGNVFFAWYSRALRSWLEVFPGGEKPISEPQMLLLDEDYVKTHVADLSKGRRPSVKLRKGRLVQYELAI